MVIEIKGEEAETIMADFHNKNWDKVSEAVCRLMKQATFKDAPKEEAKEEKEDKHALHYPDGWSTERIYEIINKQADESSEMINVMMHMALESNLSEVHRKPVWEIIRLLYSNYAELCEMLEYIDENGYIVGEKSYEWDDEDEWDDYEPQDYGDDEDENH